MDWLRRAAADRPAAPALVTPGRVVTYAELDRAADAVATIVVQSGLDGGAVAFWGERHPSAVAALWGIPRGGATAVPVDPAWPPDLSMRLTRLAGAVGLWSTLDDAAFDRLLARTPLSDLPGSGPPGPCRYVVFTSGSEGEPRGVVLTGENVAASVAGSAQRLGNGPDDAWLAVLPTFHVGGLSILWRQAEQAAPVILEPTFDSSRATALLDGSAFASVVPTMLRRVLAAGAVGSATLRGVLVGGGPADRHLLERAIDAGIPALQTYGMTETTSQVATVAPGEERIDLGTAGCPIDGAEVRIGEEGRIEVRGPMVSPGYLGEPAREPGSWLRSGDLGEIDGGGRLVVLGRADAVIVTGGEKVHPAAVEAALRGIRGVVDARVAGAADPEWGSRVVGEVVLDGVTVEEVAAAARRLLPPSAVPKEWRPVASLPTKLL